MLGINGVYNLQNDKIGAVERSGAHKKGNVKQTKSFSRKVMIWSDVCSKGVSPLVIFEDDTVDYAACIERVLLVALKYGEKIFGNNRIFQQSRAGPQLFNV